MDNKQIDGKILLLYFNNSNTAEATITIPFLVTDILFRPPSSSLNPAIQTTSPISNTDTKESTEALFIPQSTLRIPPTAADIRKLVSDFDEITFPIPSHDLVHMKLELSRVMKSDDHTGIQVFFNYSRLRKWVDDYSAVNGERRQNLFAVYTRTFDNIIQHSKQSHEDERLVDL